MNLCLRWYGPDDPVPLKHIRQVPGVKGVVGALFDIPVGQAWPEERISELKGRVQKAGLELMGIESVPVHEDIKLGLPGRDELIRNYRRTIRNLGKQGVGVVCYNFMPVFDWLRTDLAHQLTDGSTCLSYDHQAAKKINPLEMGDFDLPAWAGDFTPERLRELFAAYESVNEEKLWDNLAYFLEQVVPVAEESSVLLGMHPDDPPWPIFGLPRIIRDEDSLARLLALVNSPANGLSLCTGSLGANPDNDLPRMIRRFGAMGRIHFAHVRNVLPDDSLNFRETAHPTMYGGLDMFEIMKAYHEVGFKGIWRPDHGRMIWGESGKAGYGLYDRALGATYLLGLWEAINRTC